MRTIALALLVCLVGVIPVETVAMIPGAGTISKLIGGLAFGVGLIFTLYRRRFRSLLWFPLLFAVYMLWMSFSYWWSIDQVSSAKTLWRFFQNGLMIWLIWELARTLREQKLLMQAYVIGAFVAIFSILYNFGAGRIVDSYFQRYSAFSVGPNRLALLLALAIPMAWYLSRTSRSALLGWVNWLYVPAGAMGVLLTGSRGGMLTAGVALLYLPLSYSNISSHGRASLIVGVLAVTTAAAVYIPESTYVRLFSVSQEAERALSGDETAGSNRLNIWKIGGQMYLDYPVTGVGVGAYGEGFRRYAGGGRSKVAHNSFIEITVEQGPVGLLLFLSLLGLLIAQSRRMQPMERKLFLILLASWVVSVMFISESHTKHTWFVLGLFAAHGAAVKGAPAPKRNGVRSRPPAAAPPVHAPRALR